MKYVRIGTPVIAVSAANPPSMPITFITRRQEWERDDAGHDARHDEIAERIDGRRFERIDLLGHLHRAQLGADARANATGQQKAGVRGPVSRTSAMREPGRNERLCAKSRQRRARVHRQHDADRKAAGRNQRHGPAAQLEQLTNGLSKLVGRPECFRDHASREPGEFAHHDQELHLRSLSEQSVGETYMRNGRITALVLLHETRVLEHCQPQPR